jgi:long-subunit fatty acid transport protein
MKRFLALSLVLVGANAMADSTRSIYDLMYLPQAGTAYGITDARYSDWRLMDRGTKVDFKEYNANQTLGYSLTDMFSLSARIGYDRFKNEDANTVNKGVTDPVINARLRLMDGDYRLDILVEGLISLGDEIIESDGDGNALSGGHQLAAGAQFGQKQKDWQWSVTGLVRRYFESNQENRTPGGIDIESDAHFGVDLAADILGRLSETSNLRAYMTTNIEQGYDDDQNLENGQSSMHLVGLEYQYVISNDLLVRGGINYRWVDTQHIQQYDAISPNVAANYQF